MNSLKTSETIDCDIIGEKTFIHQLLGEMKSQFNSTEKKQQEEDHKIDLIKTETDNSMNDTIKSSQDSGEQVKSDENNVNPIEIKEEDNNLDDEKPRIVLLFKKPNNDLKDTSPNRRTSLRNKSFADEKVDENVVKRSSRRRSKDCNESVLQSAIARKEKSYNESNKPQRLSRPLKPTKKILENLELAKQEHKSKAERTKSPTKAANSDGNYDGLTDDETNGNKRKHKHQHNNKTASKRHSKRIRSFESDKESDSDLSGNLDDGNHLEAIKCTRRSQRISSRWVGKGIKRV